MVWQRVRRDLAAEQQQLEIIRGGLISESTVKVWVGDMGEEYIAHKLHCSRCQQASKWNELACAPDHLLGKAAICWEEA